MPNARVLGSFAKQKRPGFKRFQYIQAPPPRNRRGCSSYPPEKSSIATERDASPRNITPSVDHRKIASQQKLLVNSPYSPGSPLFTPKGTALFNRILGYLKAQGEKAEFDEVITPLIYKKSLWKSSGHWDNYKDDMFEVKGRGASGQLEDGEIGEDEEYGLKPMNCPGHCLLFKSENRSYKDLPIRYSDFSSLHRNEISGSLTGLTRVRRFHQDDGHIFCRPIQIGSEIQRLLSRIDVIYKAFGLPPHKMVLSTRPNDHIGTVEDWEKAEATLKQVLDDAGQEWTVNEGDGAFYGPKIDIILKDSNGKEHQTATIQLDFQLPKRFGLEYQAPAAEFEQRGELIKDPELLSKGGLVTPVLIHRAVVGSIERFMALLMEHYEGKWPYWLSPRRTIFLSLNDTPKLLHYIKGVGQIVFPSEEIEIDSSGRQLGTKNMEAQKSGWAVIVTVGPRNMAAGTISVDFTRLPERSQAAVREYMAGPVVETSSLGKFDNGSKTLLNRVNLKPEVLSEILEKLSQYQL